MPLGVRLRVRSLMVHLPLPTPLLLRLVLLTRQAPEPDLEHALDDCPKTVTAPRPSWAERGTDLHQDVKNLKRQRHSGHEGSV
uniref:Secreted protein n=1 Tax=Knipowitschia caucasica TaxID=637954 RepID=A0AAV2MJV5_KNICA